MRSTRLAPLATTLLLVTLGVTACGDDTEPEARTSASPAPETPSSSEPSATPSDSTPAPAADRTRIDVTFEGDSVTPNGDRVPVPLGEEFELVVKADAPGSLHVHATPELELAYKAGTTTLPLTIDQPGVVEVESHELDVVVVQLEVR